MLKTRTMNRLSKRGVFPGRIKLLGIQGGHQPLLARGARIAGENCFCPAGSSTGGWPAPGGPSGLKSRVSRSAPADFQVAITLPAWYGKEPGLARFGIGQIKGKSGVAFCLILKCQDASGCQAGKKQEGKRGVTCHFKHIEGKCPKKVYLRPLGSSTNK